MAAPINASLEGQCHLVFLFSVTLKKQKTYLNQWNRQNNGYLTDYNYPTCAQKLVLILYGCRWLGWKWIAKLIMVIELCGVQFGLKSYA